LDLAIAQNTASTVYGPGTAAISRVSLDQPDLVSRAKENRQMARFGR
jgi:hypothetical protein